MLDLIKDKILLPLIYAAAIISAAIIGIFMVFSVSPVWLRFFPYILIAFGFFGGFALSFVPVFKGRKFLPVICVTVAAVLTGILIAVLL
jgi:hypothetical protein